MRKIAVGVPCFGELKADFSGDLGLAVGHANMTMTDVPTEMRLFRASGSILPAGRADIANAALEWGADAIIWLDSDMRIPPDTFSRLMNHRRPIVGANYCSRREPYRPTAWKKGGRLYTTNQSTGLEPVVHLGFGCVWTSTEVFKRIPKPWFMFGYTKQTDQYVGEDVYFCHQAALHGYQPLVDHDLSKEVGHIGEIVLYNAHAELGNERMADLDFDTVKTLTE